MSVYARISGGAVAELFTPPAGIPITECFTAALTWVDVTNASPAVQPGWTAVKTNSTWVFTAPVVAVAQPITTISASDFLARFTPAEQAAVQQACISNAQIALGLTLGLAKGTITLTSPVLVKWLAALVAVGALTSARSTEIMTP